MKRLSILLDDIAILRSTLENEFYDPVRVGVLAEIAGANGLATSYFSQTGGITERDLRLLKEVRKSFLNIRVPVDDQIIRTILSVSPDMVTFTDARPGDSRAVLPVDLNVQTEQIQMMIPDLQANNISVSMLISPEINMLKSISRLSVDYVELFCEEYTRALDTNEELVALDKIQSAAVACTKLGLGVIVSGQIGYEHLPTLSQIPNIEEIVLGGEFTQRSMMVGIDRAIRDAVELVRSK